MDMTVEELMALAGQMALENRVLTLRLAEANARLGAVALPSLEEVSPDGGGPDAG